MSLIYIQSNCLQKFPSSTIKFKFRFICCYDVCSCLYFINNEELMINKIRNVKPPAESLCL